MRVGFFLLSFCLFRESASTHDLRKLNTRKNDKEVPAAERYENPGTQKGKVLMDILTHSCAVAADVWKCPGKVIYVEWRDFY